MSLNPITRLLNKGPRANPVKALGRPIADRATYNEARANPDAIRALAAKYSKPRPAP